MRWPYGDPRTDEYQVSIEKQGIESEWDLVSNCQDFRVEHVLLWMYNHFVYFMPGDDITANEELRFNVLETMIQSAPVWLGKIKCFSIWDQEVIAFTFKLKASEDFEEEM